MVGKLFIFTSNFKFLEPCLLCVSDIIELGLTCCLVNILQVEVEFDNGSHYNLSAEYLRIYSPAVDSKIRSVGGEKVTRCKFLSFLLVKRDEHLVFTMPR